MEPTGIDQPTRSDGRVRGEVWIRLPQDLDRNAAFDCGTQFRRAMQNVPSTIVMVCSDIRFVDSGGLRFLLESQRSASAADVRVILAEPSPILVQLVHFTGVSDYLHLEAARTPVPDDDGPAAMMRGHSPHWFPVAGALD